MEDFASLLKTLWSQEYLCVFPSKFKRGLIKYKSQFAGNEQQDSQVLLFSCCSAATLCEPIFGSKPVSVSISYLHLPFLDRVGLVPSRYHMCHYGNVPLIVAPQHVVGLSPYLCAT